MCNPINCVWSITNGLVDSMGFRLSSNFFPPNTLRSTYNDVEFLFPSQIQNRRTTVRPGLTLFRKICFFCGSPIISMNSIPPSWTMTLPHALTLLVLCSSFLRGNFSKKHLVVVAKSIFKRERQFIFVVNFWSPKIYTYMSLRPTHTIIDI